MPDRSLLSGLVTGRSLAGVIGLQRDIAPAGRLTHLQQVVQVRPVESAAEAASIYSEVWAAMSVIGAPWWPVTGGRWLASCGLSDASGPATYSLPPALRRLNTRPTAGLPGQGQPPVAAPAVFKTVRASLNSKSAPKGRNTDGFQTVWSSRFAAGCLGS